jgi:hypothetical protein
MADLLTYVAICTNCDEHVETNNNGRFLHPFFLPQHCPFCGDRKLSSLGWGISTGWRWEVYLRRRYRDEPFNLWRPSTWFPKTKMELIGSGDHP